MEDPTRQGASDNQETLDNDANNETNSDSPVDSRNEMLDKIHNYHEHRTNREIAGEDIGIDRRTQKIDLDVADGVISSEQMHTDDDDPEEIAAVLEVDLDPPEKKDPAPAQLDDFIAELEDGTPALKMLVDGVETLVPLKDVQTREQKETAVEIRARQNADWAEELGRKQQELEQRQAQQPINSPPSPDVGDQSTQESDLDEAQAIVDDLLHGDSDEAVASLARVISRARVSSPTPVDTKAIATEAANLAKEMADRDSINRGFVEGLKTFKEEFADTIMKDQDLYDLANSKTNRIAQEHPDWNPTEVMREAGKQTLKLFNREPVTKVDGQDTEADASLNDRQSQKDKLVPLPKKASAVKEAEPEAQAQTPQDVVAEMRANRGQG